MITFIFIAGVLFRVLPMIAVLWLIWHVTRTPTSTGLRSEREAAYWWPPAPLPETAENARAMPRGRPSVAVGKTARRARVLAADRRGWQD